MTLEEIIRNAGYGVQLLGNAPSAELLLGYQKLLEEASKLCDTEPALTLATLDGLYEHNLRRLRTFLECWGSGMSAELLVAAWRILHGWDILILDYRYTRGCCTSFCLTLKEPRTNTMRYTHMDLNVTGCFPQQAGVIAFLRRVGIFEIDGAAVLCGLHADA